MKVLSKRLLALMMLAIMPAVSLMLPAAAQSGTSALRFVHAVPGAPAIDIFVDGDLAQTGLAFGETTSHIEVSPGPRSIVVRAAGSGDTLWEQTIMASTALTLIASSPNSPSFVVFEDDLTSLAFGNARLTGVHAIEGAPTVDVVLDDGRPVMPGLAYGMPYGTIDLPAGRYDITLVPEGATLEEQLIPVTTLALTGGTSYIAVALGTPEQPELLLLSTSVRAEANSGFVRFAHGVAAAPPVDIYLDGVLIAPELAFEDATGYIAMPAGEYAADIRLAGEADSIIATTLTISAGQYQTAIAFSGPQGLLLETYLSEIAMVGPRDALVQIVNAAGNESTMSAALSSGERVIIGVQPGAYELALVAPTMDTLIIETATATTTIPTELALDGIYGGTFYEVFGIPSEAGAAVIALPPFSAARTAASTPFTGTAVAAMPTTGDNQIVLATPVPPADQIILQPATEAPAPEQAPAEPIAPMPAVPTPTVFLGPTARVLVDPGANLQMREYPSTNARSLGLAPSGSILNVLGREGEPTRPIDATPDPEATEFVDPAQLLEAEGRRDLVPAETWLYATYNQPGGGSITAWVNALFLAVNDPAGRTQRLADLPTIPANRPGQISGEVIAPPLPTANPLADTVIAEVRLDPNANLHLRRRPSTAAESLRLIPSGTQLVVSGRTEEGDWLEVTYEGQRGWVASQFVILTFNGRAYDAFNLPVVFTPTPTPTPEGEVFDEEFTEDEE